LHRNERCENRRFEVQKNAAPDRIILQNKVLKIREKRLKEASKKLSEAKIDHKFKIPEEVQFIPYFLSEVAKDQKLAKDVWSTIEDLANNDWERVYSKWDSGETTQHADDRKYAIVTIYSGKH